MIETVIVHERLTLLATTETVTVHEGLTMLAITFQDELLVIQSPGTDQCNTQEN